MKKYLFKIRSVLLCCCFACCFVGCSKKDWIDNIQKNEEKEELNENTYEDEKKKEEMEALSQQSEIKQQEIGRASCRERV